MLENRDGRFVSTMTVKNTGSRAAHDVGVRMTDGRTAIRHTTLSGLPYGHTTQVQFTSWATRGRHTFTGSVDPRNRVAESNEADNKQVTHGRGS